MSIKIVLLSIAFILVSAQAQGLSNEDNQKPPVLGAPELISVDDAKIQELSKVALANLQTSAGGNDKLSLVKIHKASKQVVAGMKYDLTMEVSNSKNESKKCEVQIVEQPWISSDPKVISASCENKPLAV
nr:PREDICTED: putative cysteine proteinase inhibitor 7 [Bemisia tabaci]